MTDITTKLRQGQCSFELNGEACREIDRLRAEVAAFKEANSYINGELDDALEDARKYCDAQKEIARLRDALSNLLAVAEGQGGTKYHAHDIARAALAPVEVGK